MENTTPNSTYNHPEAYTEEETREKFLKSVWSILNYWNDLPNETTQHKMSGAAFSILAMIDGSQADMPQFILAPTKNILPAWAKNIMPKIITLMSLVISQDHYTNCFTNIVQPDGKDNHKTDK